MKNSRMTSLNDPLRGSHNPYNDKGFIPMNSNVGIPVVTDAEISKGDYSFIIENLDKLPGKVRKCAEGIIGKENVSYRDKILLQNIKKIIIKSKSLKERISVFIKKIIRKEEKTKKIGIEKFRNIALEIEKSIENVLHGENDYNLET